MVKKHKVLGLMLLMSLIFFACPKKVTPPPPQEVEPPRVETEIDTVEPSIRGDEFVSIPELKNVYFDFDRYDLTEEAKKILQKNAEYLIANPQYEVLVEGHTCECGSNEYNLGLGQKRANAVRDYYINLGVRGNRIATISYGEEKPINPNAGPPDTPLCKANRRAETKVRVKK